MLFQRVITAIVLVTVFIISNFWFPEIVFVFMVGLITLVGAWEWARLGQLDEVLHRYIYVLILSILMGFLLVATQRWKLGLIVFGALWWIYRFILLFTDRLSNKNENILISGLWVLMIAWLSIISVHKLSPSLLLAGLVWVWGADSFAYFAGKRFGKNKLAPKISPGKTREGVIGGVIGVIILAIVSALILDLTTVKWPIWLCGAALISIICVGGDLFESWLKRNAGIKDSGTILPGHGGVLDRMDSVIAAMPFYYLLVVWFIV